VDLIYHHKIFTTFGDFSDLTEEQIQLRDAVRKFTREEIIPKAGHYDQTMEFPWEVIKKAHANGFMNVDIASEYGLKINDF
jgi:acyl-CoA dehydrogenase